METARLLYYYYYYYFYYYQACEAGEGIIGHRGIRFFCLSVCHSTFLYVCVCLLYVCVVCLSSNSSQPMGPIITKIRTQVL